MKRTLLLILLFPLWSYAQSPVAYFESGTKKAALGKYAAAIADFTEAIGLDTRYEKAYHQRALARIHLGDFTSAAADLTMVLMINPKESTAFRERAGLLGAKGELAGYTAQIELDRKNINAYQQRANVKSHVKDYPGAIADNTAVTRLDPTLMLMLTGAIMKNRLERNFKPGIVGLHGYRTSLTSKRGRTGVI